MENIKVIAWKRHKIQRYGDIKRHVTGKLRDGDDVDIYYHEDKSVIVSRFRSHPVFTTMSVHLKRPTREGKRIAIKYVLESMNRELQDHELNEALDV